MGSKPSANGSAQELAVDPSYSDATTLHESQRSGRISGKLPTNSQGPCPREVCSIILSQFLVYAPPHLVQVEARKDFVWLAFGVFSTNLVSTALIRKCHQPSGCSADARLEAPWSMVASIASSFADPKVPSNVAQLRLRNAALTLT